MVAGKTIGAAFDTAQTSRHRSTRVIPVDILSICGISRRFPPTVQDLSIAMHAELPRRPGSTENETAGDPDSPQTGVRPGETTALPGR